jgi:hypothetical protein
MARPDNSATLRGRDGHTGRQLGDTHDVVLLGRHPRFDPAEQALGKS